jgi:hypothetical protein
MDRSYRQQGYAVPGTSWPSQAMLLNCAVMLGVIDKIKVVIVIVMVRAP